MLNDYLIWAFTWFKTSEWNEMFCYDSKARGSKSRQVKFGGAQSFCLSDLSQKYIKDTGTLQLAVIVNVGEEGVGHRILHRSNCVKLSLLKIKHICKIYPISSMSFYSIILKKFNWRN